MIDFQNDGLEPQVFEALYKASELIISDELPKFQTSQDKNGKWVCKFQIPGIDTAVSFDKDTEVEAINMCASNLLYILSVIEKKGVYNPEAEESVYRDEIESYFGNVKFNKEYNYLLSHSAVIIDDDYLRNYILNQLKNNFEEYEQDGEIDRICDWFDVTYLLKFRKKNYC